MENSFRKSERNFRTQNLRENDLNLLKWNLTRSNGIFTRKATVKLLPLEIVKVNVSPELAMDSDSTMKHIILHIK